MDIFSYSTFLALLKRLENNREGSEMNVVNQAVAKLLIEIKCYLMIKGKAESFMLNGSHTHLQRLGLFLNS